MKIATFNVNSVRSRMGILLDWLKTNRPDVICLQETKVVDADFPLAPIREAGYHAAYCGEKSYNGVAILSLSEPREVRFGLDDGGQADETRLACVVINGIPVVNTYIPQGRDIEHAMYRYKIEWLGRLRNYFDRHFSPRKPLIWTGDLNIARAAADIHNASQQTEHVCYHVDARQAFEKTVEWGFVDVFRKHCPDPGQYTYFDYRQRDSVARNLGWRIDYIMATRPLAAKSTDARIDLKPRLEEKPSDHTVLVAEFDV